jgi:hypothetical protein
MLSALTSVRLLRVGRANGLLDTCSQLVFHADWPSIDSQIGARSGSGSGPVPVPVAVVRPRPSQSQRGSVLVSGWRRSFNQKTLAALIMLSPNWQYNSLIKRLDGQIQTRSFSKGCSGEQGFG